MHMNSRAGNLGRFVVIEGPNMSGKSTFAAQLNQALRSDGVSVCLTREPGGTRFGEAVREVLLATATKPTPMAAALGFAAVRAEHLAAVVDPATSRGETVICDRYNDSTRVFQLRLGNLGVAQQIAVEALLRMFRVPDLTIYILPTPDLLRARMSARRLCGTVDSFEGDTRELQAYESEFAERVRKGDSGPYMSLRPTLQRPDLSADIPGIIERLFPS